MNLDRDDRPDPQRWRDEGGTGLTEPGSLTLRFLDADDPRVEEVWRGLEPPAFFLGWGWVSCWLAMLPKARRPRLAVVARDGAVVAAGFLGRRRVLRHGFVASRELHLNATGFERYDELCLEHNGWLVDPAGAPSLAELVELLPGDWDELVLPALAARAFPGHALAEPLPHYDVHIERDVAAPFVDLGAVRAAGGGVDGYLSLLAANTRAQLRRARRGVGPVALEIAADRAHAFDIYDELVRLHEAHWRARGKPGAFAEPWFDGFHRRLVRERFAHGEIQLLRVRAGGTTLGCLYNLVSSGRVLFYQSGLAEIADPRLKAGLLCHAEAVAANAAAGHATYDLLGGDSRYKRSLATGEERLIWARVQRRLARFSVEKQLQSWKQRWSGRVMRRSTSSGTSPPTSPTQ